MYQNSNPKQRYLVMNELTLEPKQEKVLIRLYQPLVGALGVALYQTLLEEFDAYQPLSKTPALYNLQELLDCSLRQLFTAIHKLEATGLLTTYVSHNQVMGDLLAFKLNKVPDAGYFFNTDLLASLLREKIGSPRFSQLSRTFARNAKRQERQLENLEDVSASFFEVFRLPDEEVMDPSSEVKAAARENVQVKDEPVQLKVKQVDWQFLKDCFARYQIPASEVDRCQGEIQSIMELYGLSEQEFVDETLPTLHGSYQLNPAAIRKSLAYNFKADHRRQEVLKQQEQGQQVAGDQRDQALLTEMHEKAPAEFLSDLKKKKGGFSTARERFVINNLQSSVGLAPSLINALVYTCLNYQSVVTQDLAGRIANDWLQKKITTPEAALKYVRERALNNQQKKRSYTPQRTTEKVTDWSKKEFNDKIDLSDDELRKMLNNINPDKDKR